MGKYEQINVAAERLARIDLAAAFRREEPDYAR
jgi:hypothetical protein